MLPKLSNLWLGTTLFCFLRRGSWEPECLRSYTGRLCGLRCSELFRWGRALKANQAARENLLRHCRRDDPGSRSEPLWLQSNPSLVYCRHCSMAWSLYLHVLIMLISMNPADRGQIPVAFVLAPHWLAGTGLMSAASLAFLATVPNRILGSIVLFGLSFPIF